MPTAAVPIHPILPQYSLRGSADRLDTAEYRYVSSPFPGEYNPKDPSWRVRVRPDGSRYITKRPSKARRIRDQREDQINEERSGQTTDDETVSDYKLMIGEFKALDLDYPKCQFAGALRKLD
ncbi:unnamed protein product [Cyprideis torosa]|uniref:Uncharacterized protein n=1 Tax=Cyprideis torosa TaxID=163714 RepID=A0A7R8WE57_9CRUS|nr:unnamed protein product [Cyprideis torosa]CAG0895377.1 unnamed protein product [Cyprideis torosa]